MRHTFSVTSLLNLMTSRTLAWLAVGLFSLLISRPDVAIAGRKIASVRPVARDKNAKPTLNEKAWESLNRAYLLKLIRDTNDVADTIKNPDDYRRVYFKGLGNEDRAYIERGLQGDYTPLRILLDGNTMVFQQMGEPLRVEWPKITEFRFIVNGVEWKLNPKQPLASQIELLSRKLQYARDKKSSSAALSLLFPAAHANLLVTAASKLGVWGWGATSSLGTFLLMGGGGALIDASCVVSYDFLKSSWASRCAAWKENLNKIEQKDLTNSAAVKSLEHAKPEATNPEGATDWIPSSDQSCPTAADASRNVYAAEMLQLQVVGAGTPNSKVIPQNDWFSLRIEFSADKKPKTGFIAPKGTDTSAPDAISKATDILVFDDRGFLKEIRYKNLEPQRPDDLTYKPTLTIDMNTENSNLSPAEVSRKSQIRSLVQALDGWIAFCVKKELIYKYIQQKKEGVNPQTNEVEAVNGRPVPPPVEPNVPSKVVK